MEVQNSRSYELLKTWLPELKVVLHEELKRMVARAKLAASAPVRLRLTRTSSSAAESRSEYHLEPLSGMP